MLKKCLNGLALCGVFSLAACASLDLDLPFLAATPTQPYSITTAHPLATAAGADVLENGGTAVDAAVAVQTVLGLVEPQSSGIGGGAFLLYWDARKDKLSTYDGRETAPASTTGDQFLSADGKKLSYRERVLGGQSVGVPGVMPMLALAHRAHGNKDWASLLKPAEEIADAGFEMSPRLNLVAGFMSTLKLRPDTRAYFYGEGEQALAVGTLIKNPAYAETMRALARDPRALNEGPIAQAIAETALDRVSGESNLTLEDLASYEPKIRDAICAPYRIYTVCGMGPPSSGGTTVLQILGILENHDLSALSADDPQFWHLFVEAQKLAFADRNQFLGDPDFVQIPQSGLVDRSYLKSRAALIDSEQPSDPREPGLPPGSASLSYAPQSDQSQPSTTHFSIVDSYGNAVSMTASIEGPFGSHIMVGGFLLNNELTDFSAFPTKNGNPVANAAAPGRRPLSSMSPTIVFDEAGEPIFIIGSPGGKSIIGYVAKTLLGKLDFGLPLDEAISLPNVINQNGATRIEDNDLGQQIAVALKERGHEVELTGRLTSGLNGIWLGDDEPEVAADKRREGNTAQGMVRTSEDGNP